MARANASIKALRALLRNNRVPFNEMTQHVDEIAGDNDRLVTVVWASLVEGVLVDLLTSAMPNGAGVLFDPKEPLSSFSAKIALAYSLNLRGSRTFHVLTSGFSTATRH
jgi:hypothetical protein